ncbi:hypothetical protein BP00DRAFT_160762 [Aspergillus indologenus CBS 114.80]|uniref:Uncharacterized protein n=1 Tax=Aspergillus indologenus CBS 114.80 TaxID=1450541 RepID=A0A2V5I5X3_9EURO|nr:hypothetical protein BP00DRAFT_160762 [Aspergillus indologenus CBS 114.80]
MSASETTPEDTPDQTAEEMIAMLASLDVDMQGSENNASEEKPDLTAEQQAWLNAMFEPLEGGTPSSDALGGLAPNLTAEGRRILLDPANTPMPSVIDLAKALRTLRTDLTPASVAGLQLLAARYRKYTHFARRLRVEGTRTGPNTLFKRNSDLMLLKPMYIPEVRRLHNVLRKSFPLISEFELALGPAGAPFNDILNPGDVPKCLFRVINYMRRHITHLSLLMEADDWYIEGPGEFNTPHLYDCVVEDLEELRVQWPYFVDETMPSPPRKWPHPWLKFYERTFKTPVQTLILEGRGMDRPDTPVGPTLNAIPLDDSNLRNLTLTNLVLTDCDMCILIPKVAKLESITLEQVRFEGDWPSMLRMLARLCLDLKQYKFQEVEWAPDHHNGSGNDNADESNALRINSSGSSEEADFDKALYRLATFHEALRYCAGVPLLVIGSWGVFKIVINIIKK